MAELARWVALLWFRNVLGNTCVLQTELQLWGYNIHRTQMPHWIYSALLCRFSSPCLIWTDSRVSFATVERSRWRLSAVAATSINLIPLVVNLRWTFHGLQWKIGHARHDTMCLYSNFVSETFFFFFRPYAFGLNNKPSAAWVRSPCCSKDVHAEKNEIIYSNSYWNNKNEATGKFFQ